MASDSSPVNTNDGPSSPEENASSPIDNNYSSPAALRRRRRGRSYSPAQFATPPPPLSRFASSNSTSPTSRLSAAKSNGRGGVQATPSYNNEAPPSSEDVEEDGADDTTPTFVWGTNISVQDVKSAIEMFLKHFREAKENSDALYRDGKYMTLIRKVIEIEGEWIDVDAFDVFDYDPDLYNKMVRYPLEVLAIFDIVLIDIVSMINRLFEKHVQVRIFNLRTSTSMRNLNPYG